VHVHGLIMNNTPTPPESLKFYYTTSTKKWYAVLNGIVTLLLIANIIGLTAVAGHGKDYKKLHLVYVTDDVLQRTGDTRCNVFLLFVSSVVISAGFHAYATICPLHDLSKRIYTGRIVSRWWMFVFSLPPMHAGMLIGVAGVTEVWALFACWAIIVLMVSIMWPSDNAPTTTHALFRVHGLAPMLIIYITFWAFAMWTGDYNPFAVGCLIALLAVVFGINSILVREKTHGPLYKEAAMTISSFTLHAGVPWLWVAANGPIKAVTGPWTALCVIAVASTVAFVWALQNVDRINLEVAETTANTPAGNQMLLPDAIPAEPDDVIIDALVN
jgi:hypothetical protein